MSDQSTDDLMKGTQRVLSAIEGMIKLLGPLQSDERRRAIQGTLVILREPATPDEVPSADIGADGSGASISLSPRAKVWAKQYGVTADQLLQVFDISDGAAVVIASQMSGKTNAEKSIKAYVLTGLGALLTSGEPNFSDKAGRDLCETFGCYDSNHSKYLKEKNSYLVGSKEKGWKLTGPGLNFAASIVKEMAGQADAK